MWWHDSYARLLREAANEHNHRQLLSHNTSDMGAHQEGQFMSDKNLISITTAIFWCVWYGWRYCRWKWCNILTSMIFHYPARTNVNTCPIPVRPPRLHSTCHTYDLLQNPPGHTQIGIPFRYSICVCPLSVLGNRDVSECYSASELESDQSIASSIFFILVFNFRNLPENSIAWVFFLEYVTKLGNWILSMLFLEKRSDS